MNAMNRPRANARVTLSRWNAQHPRSTTSLLKGFKHQSFSSVVRSGVMRLSQCCMDCDDSPPKPSGIMPFSPVGDSDP